MGRPGTLCRRRLGGPRPQTHPTVRARGEGACRQEPPRGAEAGTSARAPGPGPSPSLQPGLSPTLAGRGAWTCPGRAPPEMPRQPLH